MNTTLSYYERHAAHYAEQTRNVDMQPILNAFVPLLSPSARLLDVGCGSGRDSLYFARRGFEVIAVDGSPALVDQARDLLADYPQATVLQQQFLDLKWDNHFDGIWACASLLHCTPAELPRVLSQLTQALKAGGVFYLSFKYGTDYRRQGARHFLDMNEKQFKQLLQTQPELALHKLWLTPDQRPERRAQWFNVIVRKLSP